MPRQKVRSKTEQAKKGTGREVAQSPAVQNARAGSKKAAILELLQRASGATLPQLMTASGWQAHSVRGFLSASVRKSMGLKLESSRGKDDQLVYRVRS